MQRPRYCFRGFSFGPCWGEDGEDETSILPTVEGHPYHGSGAKDTGWKRVGGSLGEMVD